MKDGKRADSMAVVEVCRSPCGSACLSVRYFFFKNLFSMNSCDTFFSINTSLMNSNVSSKFFAVSETLPSTFAFSFDNSIKVDAAL